MAKALLSVGKKDLQEMIDEGKEVELNCHFCNTNYKFSVAELKELRGSFKIRGGTMRQGFVKMAAATPDVKVADCVFNREQMVECIHRMEEKKAKVMACCRELVSPGYTCGDLFCQDTLLTRARKSCCCWRRKQRMWTP